MSSLYLFKSPMSGAGPLHFGPVRRSDNAEFVFLLAELITSVLLIVAVTKEPCRESPVEAQCKGSDGPRKQT